jgi:hypothetical protein
MPPLTGVLVVHGIGAQEPGETAAKLLAGLARLEPPLAAARTNDDLTLGGVRVRLYEVYWADLLKGPRSHHAFLMQEFQSLSWFPWFNQARGNYTNGEYSFAKLAWWRLALPIVNFFVLFAYYGARFIAQVFGAREQTDQKEETPSDMLAAAEQAAARTTGRTKVDVVLDEYAGDILSYVNSAGDAFHREKDEPDVPSEVRRAYAPIVGRFYAQLLRASRDGCDSIHIVAHSLGTVVTYHALSGLRFAEAPRGDEQEIRAALARVKRLYTIGSPLEKIRFFWPRLATATPFATLKLTWDNFVSWFDPVAGQLHHFDRWGAVRNHHLLGGGFLRGHVVYEHSPIFLEALARGLCGHDIPFARTSAERWRDALVLTGETIFAPLALTIVVMIGFMFFILAALIVPYLLSLALRLFLPWPTVVRIENAAAVVFIVLMVLAFTLAPVIRASRVHRQYWVSRESRQPSHAEP